MIEKGSLKIVLKTSVTNLTEIKSSDGKSVVLKINRSDSLLQ